MKIDDNKYLGKLCVHGHDYKNTGKSLRYKKFGRCIKCAELRRQNHQLTRKKTKITSVALNTKARIYASELCIHYHDCLSKAALTKHGGEDMKCYQCPKFEKRKSPWK